MPLIDGKALAQKIRAEIKDEVRALGSAPRLNVMLVGDDPASHLYVALKKKAADEAGITVDVHHIEAVVSDESLVGMINEWNRDPAVDAILVQIPLPMNHDENRVIEAIDPKKDADGFHPANANALLAGDARIIPPVHEGILRLINETPLKLPGCSAVILANTDIFAAPLQRLLSTSGMSVEIMKPDEIDAQKLKEADVIVIAVGRPKFLTPDMTKDGAVIIDVGTNKTPDGKVRGDADLESYKTKQPDTWITPVPGGVGPMTIAQLLKNVVRLAQSRKL